MKRTVEALDQTKRDQLIRSWAREIKTQLDHLLPNKPGEADLRRKAEVPAELADSSKTASILV
jgi:hypothetical protein